jgi:hypothetical protein
MNGNRRFFGHALSIPLAKARAGLDRIFSLGIRSESAPLLRVSNIDFSLEGSGRVSHKSIFRVLIKTSTGVADLEGKRRQREARSAG